MNNKINSQDRVLKPLIAIAIIQARSYSKRLIVELVVPWSVPYYM